MDVSQKNAEASTGARAARPPRRRTKNAGIALALALAWLLGAAQAARAQDYGPGPAKVQNVQINDSFAHSVILRWDAPQNSGLTSTGAYSVGWATGGGSFVSKLVTVAPDGKGIFQIQPLIQNQVYTIAITPMDSLGNMGQTLRIGAFPRRELTKRACGRRPGTARRASSISRRAIRSTGA